jgi:NMD protein affecting ribosome stability and mRNA decay
MRVICVDASKGFYSKKLPPFKEGDILDVEQDVYYDHCYVVLLNRGIYHKKRFIPLSNIDERTEVLRRKQFRKEDAEKN